MYIYIYIYIYIHIYHNTLHVYARSSAGAGGRADFGRTCAHGHVQVPGCTGAQARGAHGCAGAQAQGREGARVRRSLPRRTQPDLTRPDPALHSPTCYIRTCVHATSAHTRANTHDAGTNNERTVYPGMLDKMSDKIMLVDVAHVCQVCNKQTH